jgi:hypothetical protein
MGFGLLTLGFGLLTLGLGGLLGLGAVFGLEDGSLHIFMIYTYFY